MGVVLPFDVGVVVEDDRWLGLFAGADKGCKDAVVDVVKSVLQKLYGKDLMDKDIVLSVVICLIDADSIQKLNCEHRNKDKPTNVLSFAYYDDLDVLDINVFAGQKMVQLGDIFLAYEVVKEEAESANISHVDHMKHMLVHGVLHILGYDHEEDGAAEEMEALEVEILRSMGVANPYLR